MVEERKPKEQRVILFQVKVSAYWIETRVCATITIIKGTRKGKPFQVILLKYTVLP